MACQREHRYPAVARRCLRLAALAAVAGTVCLLSLPAAASAAHQAGPAGGRPRPWIAITAVSPTIAQPKGKITVSGVVVNPTGSALQGLSVQLWSSDFPLTSQQAMTNYLTSPVDTVLSGPVLGALRILPGQVRAHASEQWTLTLTASQVGMHSFGTYPLAAQLNSVGGQLGVARTFLPFWPGKPESRTLKQLRIAWVWPLIDTPQQTACPALLSNELAASVAPGGRLNSLLAIGQSAAGRQAMLTWAIDPALLSDLSVMREPYRVGGGYCADATPEHASAAAEAWLAGVQAVTRQQDFFITPYADVDVAALAHHQGMDAELAAAFADGRAAAMKILRQVQRSTPAMGQLAWPPDGTADYGVLEELAANQVRAVILDSGMMPVPPTTSPASAVTTTPNGQGGELKVLLSNHTLTQILSERPSQIPGLVPGSSMTPPGAEAQAGQAAEFGKEQWFLAETAMMAAAAPATAGSVIVAPPRRWDPPPSLAAALLTETDKAPWLRPVSLAGLASSGPIPGQAVLRPPTYQVSRYELSGYLLRQVRKLNQQIRLLGSVLVGQGRGYLSTAVDGVESSVWRGRRPDQRPAVQLVHRDLDYVLGQLRDIKIVGSLRVTLGGNSGAVPVSISNNLGHAVTVRLEVVPPSTGGVVIGKFRSLVTVQGKTQRTIKVPVQAAAAGASALTLRLATPDGKLLPDKPASLTVAATHFGTLAIVIISIALVVFVLTATARAIRRGGPQDGSGAEAEDLDPMPSTGDPGAAGGEPDSVVSGGADDRPPAKEADEHASTPGRAERS